MRWCSAGPEKYECAVLLALTAAILLLRSGERVGLLNNDLHSPASGLAAVSRLAQALLTNSGGDMTGSLPSHARLLLISDFLLPLDVLHTKLRLLKAQGVQGHLLQIVDPAEETLPYEGRVRFTGLEGEGEVVLPHVESVRESYIKKRSDHQAGISAIATSLGWSFIIHRTNESPIPVMTALAAVLGEA